MIKIFLSHSSKDKTPYIDQVADKLIKKYGQHNITYDKISFEAGMIISEEIDAHLEKANLFVVFLSSSALDSYWVKKEVSEAYQRVKKSNLIKIYPIIIEDGITHEDPRIPKWMKNSYNLKPILRSSKAFFSICGKVTELLWNFHPQLEERKSIFVGRNTQVAEFENRFDDYEKGLPTCIIVSGVEGIGRKTFLSHCLKKVNLIKNAYEPLIIHINSDSSLEDFILLLYDLGLSASIDISNLITLPIEEKNQMASTLLREIQNAGEILYIEDTGCVVDHEGQLAGWFLELTRRIDSSEKCFLCLISKFKVFIKKWDYPSLLIINMTELEKKEREGLFNRHLKLEKLEISQEDFRTISNLLSGFPEQVLYAIEIIKMEDDTPINKNFNLLVEYNNKRVSILLKDFEENETAIGFIALLSQFDQISKALLTDLIEDSQECHQILEKLTRMSLCENIGSNKEYLRLIDIVRSYIHRYRYPLNPNFKAKLEKELTKFLSNPNLEDYSTAEYLFNLKEALVQGKNISEKHLIPSIYLKTMRELYEKENKYNDVIRFARKALEQKENMDKKIVFEIRYLLCMSLAKTQNQETLTEIQYITGADHNFLKGFYYRQIGKADKALEAYEQALTERENFSKAKRELVQVLIMLSEFEEASGLAKDNHERYPENPYHIYTYFMCLIKNEHHKGDYDTVNNLLESLQTIKYGVAPEMYVRAKSYYYAFYENDYDEALACINQAEKDFPQSRYIDIAKFEICTRAKNIKYMKETYEKLETSFNFRRTNSQLVCYKSHIIACEESVEKAIRFFSENIRNYTDRAKQKFIQHLKNTYYGI